MSSVSAILFLLLLSFVVTFTWAPCFIDLLYRFGLRRKMEKHRFIYRFLQKEKTGVPSMGGLLIIGSILLFTALFLDLTPGVVTLLLTMFLFGILGGIDDLKTIVFVVNSYWGLRRRHIFIIQWLFGFEIAYLLYSYVGLSSITLPLPLVPKVIELGIWFVPYAATLIVATSNSFNITDGIDGLSSGLLIIALSAFLILAVSSGNVTIASFIAVWMGALFVYLYFNINPARFMMGDVGAQPFGALLAVVALLLDQSVVLPIIGAVFFVEGASSAVQLISRRYRNGKKVLTIAPLHYHFQVKRWSEGKICMRFWLFGAVFAIAGLLVALMR